MDYSTARADKFHNEHPLVPIMGNYCNCYEEGSRSLLNPTTLIERTSLKSWDTNYWCGDFKTSNVCVLDNAAPSSPAVTMLLGDVNHQTQTILHCGACGACSSLHDAEVMFNTRSNITSVMTACSAQFAKPIVLGGTQNLDDLRSCLVAGGIDFTTSASVTWREAESKPSCMDCWTDNIQCDAVNCKLNIDCIKKFFNATNPGSLVDGCLQCDETNCGPEFIKCSGANRRSLGITSDIARDQNQVCKVGLYYKPHSVFFEQPSLE
jgi:hypothetical protein